MGRDIDPKPRNLAIRLGRLHLGINALLVLTALSAKCVEYSPNLLVRCGHSGLMSNRSIVFGPWVDRTNASILTAVPAWLIGAELKWKQVVDYSASSAPTVTVCSLVFQPDRVFNRCIFYPCICVLILEWRRWNRHRQRKNLESRGFCRECGYDLKGNVSGICPECGNALETSA